MLSITLTLNGRGHELLWSRNRVVELKDNRLAGRNCVSIRPTATQFCPRWSSSGQGQVQGQCLDLRSQYQGQGHKIGFKAARGQGLVSRTTSLAFNVVTSCRRCQIKKISKTRGILNKLNYR